MIQIDIDRYNKGQDKYWYGVIIDDDFSRKLISLDINLYDFLFNPKWGWRETFDNSPEYQKEFWEWMEKNDYGWSGYLICRNSDDGILPRHQMLLGYIIEFMQERGEQT